MLTVSFAASMGRSSSAPLAASPSAPTPYQLRTMSSRATVSPAATVMVVDFTDCDGSDGVKMSCTLPDSEPVLVTRTSERHWELTPSRWPTEGMISELAEAEVFAVGETGVTRLMETGTALDVTFGAMPPLGAAMVTKRVPVAVPFGSVDGSAPISKSMPEGGRTPLAGVTLSHGLSTAAVKGKVPPAMPSKWSFSMTICVLPAGTLADGFGDGTIGRTTARTVAELALSFWSQAEKERTR